ncbi:hypothetical protein A2U01_0099481, partial [Trifolium medium]|nr:hypothetical protein [Trifolium medium]
MDAPKLLRSTAATKM